MLSPGVLPLKRIVVFRDTRQMNSGMAISVILAINPGNCSHNHMEVTGCRILFIFYLATHALLSHFFRDTSLLKQKNRITIGGQKSSRNGSNFQLTYFPLFLIHSSFLPFPFFPSFLPPFSCLSTRQVSENG